MIVLQCDVCASMDNNKYGASLCDKCWDELRKIVVDYAQHNDVSDELYFHFRHVKPVDLPTQKKVPSDRDSKIGWDASRR